MKVFILPYNSGSDSAGELSRAMGVKMIKRLNSRWKPAPDKVVINWGCRVVPPHCVNANFINHPDNVEAASNKITCLNVLKNGGINVPFFTTNINEARNLFDQGVKEVVCRQVLRGHSGEGIVLAPNKDKVVEAPLYTQYIPKKSEYRIHVVGDRVVLVARKARKLEIPDEKINWKIRNLDGGFVYSTENVDIGPKARKMAIEAVRLLGLDFGAVDVIHNVKTDTYYILEVNTAPGLSGGTARIYGNLIERLIEGRSRYLGGRAWPVRGLNIPKDVGPDKNLFFEEEKKLDHLVNDLEQIPPVNHVEEVRKNLGELLEEARNKIAAEEVHVNVGVELDGMRLNMNHEDIKDLEWRLLNGHLWKNGR